MRLALGKFHKADVILWNLELKVIRLKEKKARIVTRYPLPTEKTCRFLKTKTRRNSRKTAIPGRKTLTNGKKNP